MAENARFVLHHIEDDRYIAGIRPTAWTEEADLAMEFESAAAAEAAMERGGLYKTSFWILKVRRVQAPGPPSIRLL